MEQWEYRVEYLAHRGGDETIKPTPMSYSRYLWELDLEKTLNILGEQGWEIVYFPSDLFEGHLDGWALFKRKKTKE